MQIVTGRRGEPHVTSRQMQAVYRSFLGDFALLDIGEKLRAEAYSNDIVRVYDGVVSVQGIYAVIAYNQYDEVYIEPVSVGKKRIDTIVLHYTKDNALDVEDMQLDVVQGEEYTDNPIAPVVPEGGDAWEGTTDIQVPIYDVEVTNFGLTVTPYVRMLTVIPTLESIAERIPETFVTGVKGDSEVSYRDGNVNITKANIGLGNVDNTADTDKPISTATQTALNLKADLTYVDAKISAAYHAGGSKTVAELTSALLIADNIGKVYNMSDSGVTTSDFVEGAGKSIQEGDNVGICNVGTEESPIYKFDLLSGFVDLSAYATTSALNAGLAEKVDKVAGKGLSTNDYTTADKNKLAGIEAEANKTVVDSAMSDSSTNPLQNKVITKELQGSKTATGNPLTIEDAAPVNAINLSMDLEPIQDLHGYDHPWVGGAGKNKLPMTVEGIKAQNGSASWSGNICTLDGVSFEIITDNDENVIGIKANRVAASSSPAIFNLGAYTASTGDILNGCPNGGGNSTYKIYARGGITGDMGSGATIASGDVGVGRIYAIAVFSGGSPSNLIFYPMIRLSTETDSSFAPYTNICPISGRTEERITQKDNLNNPTVTKTYTIQFGQTVYGGKLDVVTGKLRVNKVKRQITSTIGTGWQAESGREHSFYVYDNEFVPSAFSGSTVKDDARFVCNAFPTVTPTSCYNGNLGVAKEGDRLRLGNPSWSTVSEVMSYLTNNEVYVVYELAAPITIPLTPTQIKLLENTNTIYTDYEGDTITIEYQPNNAIGEAVRAVEESYDPEFAVRPVLKKKAFSGITDSDGAVTLINASDIPSNHRIIPLHITDMTINGSVGTYFVEYDPYNSGDSVKAYCYTFFNGSRLTPVGSAVTGNFYYYELEV